MENYRELLQELMDAIDSGIPVDRIRNSPLAVRVDAALEQPSPEESDLTDQELLRCAKIATPCYDLKAWDRELRMMRAAIAADRARFGGHSTPVPAEGEVAEIVKLLRESVVNDDEHSSQFEPQFITQIADLLELLSNWVPTDECLPPTPIPVPKRLPGPEDCDAEGRCWWGKPYGYRGRNIAEPYWIFGDSDCYRFMACALWLPATALPLPASEAQP